MILYQELAFEVTKSKLQPPRKGLERTKQNLSWLKIENKLCWTKFDPLDEISKNFFCVMVD